MWDIYGVKIAEPMTVLTNLVLFILCTYCAIVVNRENSRKKYDFVRYYALFLLFTGISALLGGIFSHGFKYYFEVIYYIPGWFIALAGGYYAGLGAFRHASSNDLWPNVLQKHDKSIRIFLLISLLAAMVLTFIFKNFLIVTCYTAFTMFVIGSFFELNIYLKKKEEGSKLYLISIGLGIVVLFVYLFKWGISPSFNQNDVAHVIMAVSMYIFMLSFLRMKGKIAA